MGRFMTTGLIRTSEPEAETHPNPLDPSGRRYIRLGPIQVDLQKEEVTNAGSRLRLSGKAYRALLALLERPGEIVTRDAIRRCLWPSNTCVDYNANVNTTLNKLRRALGDSSLKPLYIETIPRKGYALIGHPEVSDHPNKLYAPNAMEPSLSNGNPPVDSMCPLAAKSRFWSILWVVGLILIGMLFGVGMSAFWISYHG
jgi:DNA-binding winged helix-turn-helix (wHTH) protein